MTAVRHRDIALILARELAVNVATPMFVWDENGELIYFNEHVQAILGTPQHEFGLERFDEVPQFSRHDLEGRPIDISELPSAIALNEKRPAHRDVRITRQDGAQRTLSETAFPLFGRHGELVGAVTIFWPIGDGN